MPESQNKEISRLRKENAELRAAIANLNDTLSLLREQLKQSLEGNTELRVLLADLQAKLDKLLEQKKKRDRKDFGSSNERYNPRPAAKNDDVVTDDVQTGNVDTGNANEAQAEEKKKPKRNHKKNIHSQTLPTRPVPHKVPEKNLCCPDCGVETVFVRNEITCQLEKILHSLERLEHQQEVRACPKCKQHVVTAEKPCPPIPGGLPGPCLLGSTIVDKCEDGCPHYRQSKIFKREQAIIPRSTLWDWFQAGSLTLEPLYERLKREALASKVIQSDDCPVKIQNRKAKGTMRKGKMTVYRGDAQHPIIFFDFSPDLSLDRNKLILKDYAGCVQVDAAGGFDALFKDGTKIEVGCNAHSRRKYFEVCEEVLDIYRELYEIERQIKDKPAVYRLAIRRKRSKSLTQKLYRTLTKLRGLLHPTHQLMDAIAYTLKHWVALTRFLGNPDLEIDNNASERAIKDFVIARKNFLFVGSDAGGEAMAINLSLVATCKRLGINPVTYLTDVFTRINTMKTSELDQLIPHRWLELRDNHAHQNLSQPP